MPMAIMLTISISMIIMILGIMISTLKEKSKHMFYSPFECGFSPITSPRLSFSMQFVMITILFLFFDIELVLVSPLPLNTMTSMKAELTLTFILTMIFLGLLIEWTQSKISWI